MLSIIKFRWQFEPVWLIRLLLLMLPGVIASLVTHNLIWQIASFFACCAGFPYTLSYNNRIFGFFYALIICFLALIFNLLLKNNALFLLIFLAVLAIVCGILDNLNRDFRSLVTWLLIGSSYGGVKFNEVSLSMNHVLAILLLTVMGVIAGLQIKGKDKTYNLDWSVLKITNVQFILCFKYVLPACISFLVGYYFKLSELEWIFWSSLSIVGVELDYVLLKLKQRVIGAFLGVCVGLVVALLLPAHSMFISYMGPILILLSIRIPSDYFTGFFLRCLSIVIYAGNSHSLIAITRLSNVVIGGTIGLILTTLLLKLYSFLKSRELNS